MLRRTFLGGAAAALAGLLGLKRGAQAEKPKPHAETVLVSSGRPPIVEMQAGQDIKRGAFLACDDSGEVFPVNPRDDRSIGHALCDAVPTDDGFYLVEVAIR